MEEPAALAAEDPSTTPSIAERPLPDPHAASPGAAAPLTRRKARPLFASLFVWAVWAVMLASDLYLVATYGSNVPRQDDWFLVPAMTGNQPVTPAYLWSLHNEHRLPLPRLVQLSLYTLTGNDFRAPMYFNVALLGIVAAGLIYASSRLRGQPLPVDAFFPLVLLNWGHADNLLWSWQVGFVLPTALASAFLTAIVLSPVRLNGRWAALAGVCLLLLPLCGANGLLLVPALALWMVIIGVAQLRSDHSSVRRVGAAMALTALAALGLIALYLVGYHGPRMYERPDLLHCLPTSLQFLSASFGMVDVHWWPAWAAGCLAAFAAAVLAGAAVWRRQPEHRAPVLGLWLFLAAVISLALGLAWGRAGCPGAMGLAERYVTLAAPGLCAVFLLFVLCGGRAGRWGQATLFLATAAMLYLNTRGGLQLARALNGLNHQFQERVARYPPIVLADAYQYSGVAPDPLDEKAVWASWMTMLHRAGIGPFKAMPEDPPMRAIAVDAATSRLRDANVYRLHQPRRVYAVQVQCSLPRSNDRALFLFTWKEDDHSRPRGFKREVPCKDTQSSVLIWIDGPISEFSINPDARHLTDAAGAVAKVQGVQLLVPPN
jgi:hypothetical protein